MNNDKTTPDADDQDLTRLFDARQDRVPEALDTLILAAAKEAVSEPVATLRKPRGTAIKGWFAVAATLLLGITITPMLLQAPESALDRTASTGSSLKAVEESVSMTAEPAAHLMQDSESDVMDSAAREAAPMSLASPLMPAIQTQSRKAAISSSSVAREKRVSEVEDYRRSAKNWLEHIHVLIDEGQSARAQTEYDLFRKAFPDYAPEFTLD